MKDYVPTPGPLPGEQWVPSNGTVGYSFLENECGNCARDKSMREGVDFDECDDNECCPIIGASFRGEAVEWREMPDGEVKCIKFVEAGKPIPPEPDEHTLDLFAAPQQQKEQPNLAESIDAMVWANEFCRLNRAADHGTMLGWFANALMAGIDEGRRRALGGDKP